MQISKTGIFMKMDKWVSAVIGRKRNAICCPLKMLSFIILTIKSKMKLDQYLKMILLCDQSNFYRQELKTKFLISILYCLKGYSKDLGITNQKFLIFIMLTLCFLLISVYIREKLYTGTELGTRLCCLSSPPLL